MAEFQEEMQKEIRQACAQLDNSNTKTLPENQGGFI